MRYARDHKAATHEKILKGAVKRLKATGPLQCKDAADFHNQTRRGDRSCRFATRRTSDEGDARRGDRRHRHHGWKPSAGARGGSRRGIVDGYSQGRPEEGAGWNGTGGQTRRCKIFAPVRMFVPGDGAEVASHQDVIERIPEIEIRILL